MTKPTPMFIQAIKNTFGIVVNPAETIEEQDDSYTITLSGLYTFWNEKRR